MKLVLSVTLALSLASLVPTEAQEKPGAARPAPGFYEVFVATNVTKGKELRRLTDLVKERNGEVPVAYSPNVFEATINADIEALLRRDPAVVLIARREVDLSALQGLGNPAVEAARIWNRRLLAPAIQQWLPIPAGGPPPAIPKSPPHPSQDDKPAPPGRGSPEGHELPGTGAVPPPGFSRASSFLAGDVVVNVIFVESCPPFFGEEQDCEEGPRPSGPAPSTSVQDSNCNPADFDTEDWDAGLARETFVFEDISAGIRW